MPKKKTATKTRRAGRPRGAKNKKVTVVDSEATTCPKCGSSDRVAYYATRQKEINSKLPDGRVFDRVTWRRTQCKNCGQYRDDRQYNFV